MSGRRLAPLLALGLLGACNDASTTLPPLGQVLLYVDTDAPLPAPQGKTLAANDPPALFDRLRIEVLRPGESQPCAECTHEFDVDRELVVGGRASVGVQPPPHAEGYVARVRLFRAAFTDLGEPRADATIDVTVMLPPVAEEGIVPVTVFLPTDAVAHPIGSRTAPVAPEPGAPIGRAGTWEGARRVGCADAPSPDEVCIPGGAYWMGNPLLATQHIGADDIVLRVAILSPFYLQKTEVSVPTFRASRLATGADPLDQQSPRVAGQPPGVECTFTAEPGNTDAYPVNCISNAKARAFCQLRGGDLPTEAQFQYAASGLEGRLYPWGNDAPSCSDAVFSRVRALRGPDFSCAGGGISPSGSGARDRVTFEGGEVVDLAGNLAEHVADRWNLQKESCWGTGVLRDPLCDQQSETPQLVNKRVVVAGSYVDGAGFLAVAFRNPSAAFPPAQGSVDALAATTVGFRCARPATPGPAR
jgi:formylglycine-generating enzyme